MACHACYCCGGCSACDYACFSSCCVPQQLPPIDDWKWDSILRLWTMYTKGNSKKCGQGKMAELCKVSGCNPEHLIKLMFPANKSIVCRVEPPKVPFTDFGQICNCMKAVPENFITTLPVLKKKNKKKCCQLKEEFDFWNYLVQKNVPRATRKTCCNNYIHYDKPCRC